MLSIIILTSFIISTVNSQDIYASIDDIKTLVQSQSLLIENLHQHLENLRNHQGIIEERYKQLLSDHQQILTAEDDYFQNPINAFVLMKRLTTDWARMNDLMNDVGRNYTANVIEISKTHLLPSFDDLLGAALGLFRVQDVYQLDIDKLVNGEIHGAKGLKMKSDDCLEMGKQLLSQNNYRYAMLWYKKAFEVWKEEEPKMSSEVEIFNQIAILIQEVSKSGKDLDIISYILENNLSTVDNENNAETGSKNEEKPIKLEKKTKGSKEGKGNYDKEKNKDTHSKTNSQDRKSKMDEKVKINRNDNINKNESNEHKNHNTSMNVKSPNPLLSRYDDGKTLLVKRYESLCRGEINRPIHITSKLKCRYSVRKHPYTIIAPFKEEEVNLDPRIVLFHDVISDDEIETLQKISKPRLKRSMVVTPEGVLHASLERVSKVAWFKDEHHPVVAKLSKRIHHMTNLNTTFYGEELQINNYGIGGHNDLHYDNALKDEPKFDHYQKGNRLATVLFYLSDVKQGGATVFPAMDLTIFPKKNTAAFWYNLHENVEGDLRTLHAACPVLTGNKWVANKWIFQYGQEFLRPCKLEQGMTEGNYLDFVEELVKTFQ